MEPATELTNAVTERVTMPVKGGIDTWKEPLKVMLQTLHDQEGCLRTRWGPWTENQQRLELITGWVNAEASETWNKSKGYAEAMARFVPVLDGRPTSYLLRFRPNAPQAVINSPICETLTFENCRETEERMREVVERAKAMPGCNGVASGFSLGCGGGGGGGDGHKTGLGGAGGSGSGSGNTSATGSGGGDGGGRTFVAVVGWAGIEASRAANKGVYTGGMKTESHHVNFLFPVKGFGGL